MTAEASATIASVKGLVVALQAVRTTLKLPCVLTFDPTGLKLRFLDGAHAMQSGISLSASVGAGQGATVACQALRGGEMQHFTALLQYTKASLRRRIGSV